MTDIVITPITSGYNLAALNANLTKVGSAINNDVVHQVGGNNVMRQSLDMNGFAILNLGTDLLAPGSFATVADINTAIATHKTATEPMTTLGDMISGGALGVPTRLAPGTAGYVLKMVGGIPTWATEAGAGGGGIVDAPVNGNEYVRKDAAWVVPTPQASVLPQFWRNTQTITANKTVATAGNESIVGPVTVNTGITLTVATGARLVVL